MLVSAPGADDSRGEEEGPRSPEAGTAPGAVEIRGEDAGLRSRSIPRTDGGGTLSRDRGTLCGGGTAGGENVSVAGVALALLVLAPGELVPGAAG